MTPPSRGEGGVHPTLGLWGGGGRWNKIRMQSNLDAYLSDGADTIAGPRLLVLVF